MDTHFVKRFPTVEEGRKGKSIYVEGAPGSQDLKFYVTLDDPQHYKQSITKDEVDNLIRVAVTSGSGSVYLVDDIAARDVLVAEEATKPKIDSIVVVKDATGQEDFVGAGGEVYFFIASTGIFVPIYRIPVDPLLGPAWETITDKPPFGELETSGGKKALLYDGVPVGSPVVDDPKW